MQRVCEHCGKSFKCAKDSKMEHSIYNYGYNGLTLERVTLCHNCWLDLFDRRIKADDNFYKECVYGTKTSKEQATS